MTRQKRLINSVATTTKDAAHANERREDEIIRQFHQIQKGYSRLMVDVAKELDLVKNWLGTQAITKRNEIKTRLSARLSRN